MDSVTVPAMMWIAAAAALAATPVQQGEWHASATAEATVSMRVISGVVLKLDAAHNDGAPAARESRVRTEDGLVRPARLIEFQ